MSDSEDAEACLPGPCLPSLGDTMDFLLGTFILFVIFYASSKQWGE